VAPGRVRRPYLPEELAFAVVCVSQGQSLSAVAAELGRDRSGLLRTLKSLGYPTAPERPDPACRRADTLQRIESLKPLSHDEIKQRILQLRREGGSPRTGISTVEVWIQPRLASCSNIPADSRSRKSADRWSNSELAEWLPLTGAHTSGLA
jgi:transposase-like protein